MVVTENPPYCPCNTLLFCRLSIITGKSNLFSCDNGADFIHSVSKALVILSFSFSNLFIKPTHANTSLIVGDQLCIFSALGIELIMRTALNNSPLFHHDNLITIPNGR